MLYNLLSRTPNNPSSLTPRSGTAHTDESGTRHDDCIKNLCTDTSRFYVGCTISYNSQHFSSLSVQKSMRANDNQHHTHMQGEAKCDKTRDRNAAMQHKPDQHRVTQSQKRRAAHHRRSASAVIRHRNKTKQKRYTSTTQPCPHGTHDAQMKCVVPTKVLCINAPSCCRYALNYREMTYSGTIDLNTRRGKQLSQCTPTGVVVNCRTSQTGSRTLAQIMTCIHHFQAAAVSG